MICIAPANRETDKRMISARLAEGHWAHLFTGAVLKLTATVEWWSFENVPSTPEHESQQMKSLPRSLCRA